MNILKRNLIILLVAMLLMTVTLTGCMSTSSQALSDDTSEDNASDQQTLGTLRLSVDNTPMVEIDFDAEGLVLSLKVAGEEGEEVVLGYGACAGLTCREVACGLVVNMREAGYFDGEDGIQKKIVLELVAGSQCPDDSFLEDIVEGVTKTVEGFNQPVVSARPTPAPVATENPQPVETTTPAVVVIPVDTEHISLEEAKAVALTKLGITMAIFTKEEYDAFVQEYELELTVDGREYAYTISAVNGDILEEKWENVDMAQPTPAPNASTLIGVAAAREQALKHAKLTGKTVTYKEAKLDKEDGRYVYELEFVYGGMEYEYEIDAQTGFILESDVEKAD